MKPVNRMNESFRPILDLLFSASGITVWFSALLLPFTGWKNCLKLTPLLFVYGFLRASTTQNRGFSGSRLGKMVAKITGPLKKLSRNRQFITTALVLLFSAVCLSPLMLNNYIIDMGAMVWIYMILALGLNVVVGWTGLLHLGYVAFYAIGAYTYALLNEIYQLPFWLGLPAGILMAAIAGLLLGLPVLRLRGDYLAIVTLGFGEIVRIVLNNWDSLTHGPNGVMNIARPFIPGIVLRKQMLFYYLAFAFLVITVFIMRRLYVSRIGRAWIAVREDELAAESMGIPVTRYKLLAFVVGAGFAGMAGVIFASKMMFISPESFTFMESVTILCMVVLGGMGSIPGCCLGAFILVILPELMRNFSDYRMLLFGIALVTMMVSRPQGILPPTRSVEVSE